MPSVVYANASPRSVGGTSMFEASGTQVVDDGHAFTSDLAVVEAAVEQLRTAGFDVLHVSPQFVNIAGPPTLYEQAFGVRLVAEQRAVMRVDGGAATSEFVANEHADMPGLIATSGTDFNELVEGVALEEPVTFMESAFAPIADYWHLGVPDDVSAAVGAAPVHRQGVTGAGVKVCMVDSGWYAHPYFGLRGYRANPVVLGPAARDPEHDESGHGTGESANLFAVAPDIDFTMVKVNFVNSLGAFNAAVALQPDIITCSWGSSQQFPPLSAANQALGAAIGLAVDQGIVVVFSAGNGHWGYPGQHPRVISAGGVFMAPDQSLVASDYASGFASNIFEGRNCPDVSGLVGMKPAAAYIMLPVEPGDQLDRSLAGGDHPSGDETAPDDGWAAFSGTSAAAPQVAGVAALLRQESPDLSPEQVRDLLVDSAIDVVEGTNALGNVAGPGPDLATGAGLVAADRALRRLEPPHDEAGAVQ